jgi:hypothetical protein
VTGWGNGEATPSRNISWPALAQVEAVYNPEQATREIRDMRGLPLPPFVVMEKGESLTDWSQRAKPDIFQGTSVRHPACASTAQPARPCTLEELLYSILSCVKSYSVVSLVQCFQMTIVWTSMHGVACTAAALLKLHLTQENRRSARCTVHQHSALVTMQLTIVVAWHVWQDLV